ncbi:OLC1v1031168C4 [Oldenlandia corymbosa var. corymbosa]|nr:OLC1v1031168C4 [Oldenlandia corymbosa var. corymbosa]
MRHMAQNSRTVIVNGNSEQFGLSSLVVPAAAVGALGYGYMWWKGISFSDLMYVTKRGMATAVENLTKHLEHVSDALAATKRHLTQRIENLDGKLDEQMEISKLIRSDVTDVRGDLSQINCDLDELHRMVTGLDDKLLTLEAKQELANTGVLYLCSVVNGKREKMPEKLQEQLKVVGSSVPSLMGLKELDALGSGIGNNRLITDKNEKVSDLKSRSLTRMRSIAC